jgi:membrane associated rhomboid family serine protease
MGSGTNARPQRPFLQAFVHLFFFGPLIAMLRPPSLKFVPFYPVTAGLAAGAIAASGMWWTGHDISGMFMDRHVWADGELWRALTATLPHVNFLHLAFNLYWLWTFGTLVERVYGHWRCAAIYALLALGSMLGDFAVLDGGVGLSGIGYGLWGMLMTLQRLDPRFADAVDAHTNQTFVAWFLLCIGLTVTHIMPVANVAHGVGAVLGMLLGMAIAGNRMVRWRSRAGLVVLMFLILLGSTVFWPQVNLSKNAPAEIERAALTALNDGNYSRGVRLLEIAAHKPNASARTWYNLGIAYGRAGDTNKALTAFRHAAQMPDADAQMIQTDQLLEHPSGVNTNQ